MVTTLQPAAIPTSNPDSAAQLSAILTGAAIAPLDSIGWIRVTGSDRVRWLNGMVTNAIQQLAPGEGTYNFVLNAQGRILADLTAWIQEDSILLETSRDQLPALLAHLDRFIIMDDVELADISDSRRGLLVAGPHTVSILQGLGHPVGQLTTLRLQSTESLDILHAHSPLVPRIELWFDARTIAALTADLTAAGATTVSSEALEALRILSGTPRYGVDIRNTEKSHDLPQETAQARALHFSKGCYLGQEIVERIHSRGNVHRTFSGFQLTGALPEPGAVLTAEGKPVGELTSVAAIPLAEPVQLALGYIRRDALDKKLPLEYSGGTAAPIAVPYRIP